MKDPIPAGSGLPRDVEEFMLLSHSRGLDKPKPTKKLSVELADDLADSMTDLSASLAVSRSDLIAYLLRQSGERVHFLREYVKRPKEGAK